MYQMNCGPKNNIEVKIFGYESNIPYISIVIKNLLNENPIILDLSIEEAMDLGLNISKLASKAMDIRAKNSTVKRRENIFTRK